MYNRRNLIKLAIPSLIIAPNLAANLAAAASAPAKTTESNFVSRLQVTSSIMAGMRAVGIIQVDAGVYTIDDQLKTKLTSLKPVILSKWRLALQQYINSYYTAGNVPDTNMIGALFQRAIATEIGNVRARVLILSVIAR